MNESLKQGIVVGDQGARERFVRRYQDEVYTWFLLEDPETAEFRAGSFLKGLLEERPPPEKLSVWVYARLLQGGGGPFHGLHGDLRAVLFLRDVVGLPEDLAAEILNIPISTLRVRLHRARQAWRGMK